MKTSNQSEWSHQSGWTILACCLTGRYLALHTRPVEIAVMCQAGDHRGPLSMGGPPVPLAKRVTIVDLYQWVAHRCHLNPSISKLNKCQTVVRPLETLVQVDSTAPTCPPKPSLAQPVLRSSPPHLHAQQISSENQCSLRPGPPL